MWICRLCSDVKVAQQIVDLGGVTRLVQLCKEGKERNNSDAVLVACLVNIKKVINFKKKIIMILFLGNIKKNCSKLWKRSNGPKRYNGTSGT